MHVGEIRLLAGSYEPESWAWCDGRMLDPKQYPDLFQKLGTRYGGDGKTTFAIPDLRGRVPMHRAAGMQLGTGDRFSSMPEWDASARASPSTTSSA